MNKVVIDTNVILRIALEDGGQNYKNAISTLEQIVSKQTIGYLSILVIAEFFLVMKSFYKSSYGDSCDALLKFLSVDGIKTVELKKDDVQDIVMRLRDNSFGITDNYLLFLSKSKDWELATLDKKLKKLLEAP